jgi:hypothetical protein
MCGAGSHLILLYKLPSVAIRPLCLTHHSRPLQEPLLCFRLDPLCAKLALHFRTAHFYISLLPMTLENEHLVRYRSYYTGML